MSNGYDNESGMNTKGLNGNGKLVSDVANHAALVLASRVMSAIGVPLAIFVFLAMWNDISSIELKSTQNEQNIAVQRSVLTDHARRLDNAERTIQSTTLYLRSMNPGQQ